MPAWVEELVADAFLSLHEHQETIDAEQLPAWLFTVVRNRAIDYWRRRAVEDRHMNTLPREPVTDSHTAGDLQLFEHPALKPVHRLCPDSISERRCPSSAS